MEKETNRFKNHTKLDYWECYAKVVLEHIFPNEFKNIEIKDKPDLQMKNGEYGIEVTRAEFKEQLEAESLYHKISYSEIDNIEKAIKKLKSVGVNIEMEFYRENQDKILLI